MGIKKTRHDLIRSGGVSRLFRLSRFNHAPFNGGYISDNSNIRVGRTFALHGAPVAFASGSDPEDPSHIVRPCGSVHRMEVPFVRVAWRSPFLFHSITGEISDDRVDHSPLPSSCGYQKTPPRGFLVIHAWVGEWGAMIRDSLDWSHACSLRTP